MPLSRALLLPSAIAAFHRATHPRVDIDVVEGSWRELVEPLRDGEIDLMVGALRDDAAGAVLIQRRCSTTGWSCSRRAGHPLAGSDRRPRRAGALSLGRRPAGHAAARAVGGDVRRAARRRAAPIECGSVMVIRAVAAWRATS